MVLQPATMDEPPRGSLRTSSAVCPWMLQDHFSLDQNQARADYISSATLTWLLREQKMVLKTKARHRLWRDLLVRSFLQWAGRADYGVNQMVAKQTVLYEVVAAAIKYATTRIRNGVRKDKAEYLGGLVTSEGTDFADVMRKVKQAGLGGKLSRTPWRPMPALQDACGNPASTAAATPAGRNADEPSALMY